MLLYELFQTDGEILLMLFVHGHNFSVKIAPAFSEHIIKLAFFTHGAISS